MPQLRLAVALRSGTAPCWSQDDDRQTGGEAGQAIAEEPPTVLLTNMAESVRAREA